MEKWYYKQMLEIYFWISFMLNLLIKRQNTKDGVP